MPKNNKSFFEEKFGFKKNPKVEKAKDAKKERELKKKFENQEDKWEHQDKFDQSRPPRKSFRSKDEKFAPGKKSKRFSGSDNSEKPFKKKFDNRDSRDNRADKRDFKNKFDKPKSPRKTFKPGEDKQAPPKKAKRLIQPDKPEREVFYTEDDRKRIFGEEAFKDRVLGELQDEIDKDFDALKKEKAQKKKFEKRKTRDQKKSADNYEMTKYIDDESDFEIAYEASGGSKWEVEKAMDNNYRKSVGAEEEMPLNKFIAYCGICSRRDAVPLIKSGKISIDGAVCTEPGFKVTSNANVTMDGKRITIQKNIVYILMNKPKGYITTTDDPKGRRTVMDLVSNHIEERVFPVGRLDRNTTGLLLLTNDGTLAQELAHPKYEIRKIYHVVLDKNLSTTDFEKIAAGVTLEDGIAPVDHIAYLDKKNEIGIEIHSGKNRIVRRIFESCGYVVEKLDRVMYAGLTKKNIPRGKWRLLSKQEVINLKHLNSKKK